MANDITQQTTANEMLKTMLNETIILHYSNSSLVVEILNVVNAKSRASNETDLVANYFDGSYGKRRWPNLLLSWQKCTDFKLPVHTEGHTSGLRKVRACLCHWDKCSGSCFDNRLMFLQQPVSASVSNEDKMAWEGDLISTCDVRTRSATATMWHLNAIISN